VSLGIVRFSRSLAHTVATWNEIMKVKPEQRSELGVNQLSMKHVSLQDESILEAYKIMAREKIDLVPAANRETPAKVAGVLTS
jgi:hypothetical protein